MNNDFNDLEIAGHKLNCDFMKLMPDYLKEEVIEVLNKYKSYCNKDAKIVDNESKVYKKVENGVVMIFDVSTFMNVWDSYSYSIWSFRRSLWTAPSKYFKNAEREFLYPDDNYEQELSNKIKQYCKDDDMAFEAVCNAIKEVVNDKKEEKN